MSKELTKEEKIKIMVLYRDYCSVSLVKSTTKRNKPHGHKVVE